MKKILIIMCLILGLYAILFPFCYFKSSMDRKEVKISQILTDSEETIKEAKEELNKGKNFKSVVEKYSIDDSKNMGGNIGIAHKGRFDDKITKAAYKLNKKEISEPIHTDYGWHIIKVTEINYFSDSENFKYNPYKYLDLSHEEDII